MSNTITFQVTETVEHEVTINLSDLPAGYDIDTDPRGLLDALIADDCAANESFVAVLDREVTQVNG